MTDNPNSDEEPTGYGNPPRNRRFPPGVSGNPKGRPKGSKNVKTILRRLLDAEIPVTQRGVETSKSTREVLIQRMIEKAARGDRKAIEFILNLDMKLDAIEELREASDRTRALDPEDRDLVLAYLELLREQQELARGKEGLSNTSHSDDGEPDGEKE